MTAWQLVIFDLDGTLVETAPEISLAVNDTLADFNLPPTRADQVAGWIGAGTGELMVQALAFATQSAPELVRRRQDLSQIKKHFDLHYQRHCGTICRLYDGVREVLTELRQQDIKLAVLTNKDMRYTKIILDAHALSDFFALVIGGDTLSTKKPDPAGLQRCLELFNVAAGAALFVGDSSIDAATARATGVPVWLLSYGYNMNQPVEASAPDRVVDTLRSLLE